MSKERSDAAELGTGEVVDLLGVSEVYLRNLFRLGKLRKPPKRGNLYRWSSEHVEEARRVVERMRA